jgi:hypothetical protein
MREVADFQEFRRAELPHLRNLLALSMSTPVEYSPVSAG